jgi:lipid II:glycine glycyltransferase (peptidoglycan interpeptide bridge formation enzyme)
VIKKVDEKYKSSFNKTAVHPLQSWEWGEFRQAHGNKIVRLGVFKGNKITDAIQVIFSKIPHSKYTIGTVIKGPKPTKEMLDALKDLAKEENALFIKLEPSFAQVTEGQARFHILTKLLKENGCVPGKTLFTPTSFWIDLTKSEDELMRSFSSKTRYNIRLAQRKGVKVVEDNSDKAFERYLQLTKETVTRQGFYAHTENYHRLMWKYLHEDLVKANKKPVAYLLTARFKGQIITTWILIAWHQFLYYPYGASTVKYKEVMANNLMMWEAIHLGQKLRLKTFDLWGREEGKGFTKFKEGYNPQVVEFLGTWDLVTSPLYKLYKVADSARWKLLKSKAKLGLIKPAF